MVIKSVKNAFVLNTNIDNSLIEYLYFVVPLIKYILSVYLINGSTYIVLDLVVYYHIFSFTFHRVISDKMSII